MRKSLAIKFRMPVVSYKKTDDDWCSNFAGDLVCLKFHGNINPPNSKTKLYRVSVWGDDDIGMDIDFDKKTEAISFFTKVDAMPVLNQKELLAMGFNWF